MQEHINAIRIANAIMQDSGRKETILLVEGVNDNIFYNKFIENKSCETIIAFGYQNIHDVISILKNRGSNIHAIGILDQDFLGIDSALVPIPNIFYVDHHDVEMMAINTRSFETIFVTYGKKEKIKSILDLHKKDLRIILYEVIYPLSLLRYLNFKFKIGLSFKPKTLDGPRLKLDFIDHSTLEFSTYQKLVEIVYNYNQSKTNPTLDRKACLELLLKHKDELYDYSLFCNGHDLCRLISISLRKVTGNLASKAPSDDEIERSLMLGVDSSEFIQTKLYKALKDYESKNNYLILAV